MVSNVVTYLFTYLHVLVLCISQAYYESEADTDENEAVDVDVFLLVYSVTDRQSFSYVQQCLQDVAKVRRRRAGVVVVANKYDLVRNRVVSTSGSSVRTVWIIVKK